MYGTCFSGRPAGSWPVGLNKCLHTHSTSCLTQPMTCPIATTLLAHYCVSFPPCQVVLGLVQAAAYPPACWPWRQRSCSACLLHQEVVLQARLPALHLQVQAGDGVASCSWFQHSDLVTM
jgi:hypothetical protein